MKTRLPILLVTALVPAGLMMACTPQPGPNTFSQNEAGQAMTVQLGTLKGINQVEIRPGQTAVGTIAGGALGATGGSQIGRSTPASIAGAIAGSIAGAAIGSAIQGSQVTWGVELTVELDSGDWIAVVQPGNPRDYRVGDRVRVTGSAQNTRVTLF